MTTKPVKKTLDQLKREAIAAEWVAYRRARANGNKLGMRRHRRELSALGEHVPCEDCK